MKNKIIICEHNQYKKIPDLEKSELQDKIIKLELIANKNFVELFEKYKDFNKVTLVTNFPNKMFFNSFYQIFPKSSAVLVTDLVLHNFFDELGSNMSLISHIASNTSKSDWSYLQLLITLKKIVEDDIFGIHKYLNKNTLIQKHSFSPEEDRAEISRSVVQYAKKNKLGNYLSRLASGITEELIMNAVKDAPSAAKKYTDSKKNIIIDNDKLINEVQYAADNNNFIISVTDKFGSIRKETYFQYLKKVLYQDEKPEKILDSKEGGAGLGLFKILYSCHSLVCNCKFMSKTEMIAIIDLKSKLRNFKRMPRSIHFFSESS